MEFGGIVHNIMTGWNYQIFVVNPIVKGKLVAFRISIVPEMLR